MNIKSSSDLCGVWTIRTDQRRLFLINGHKGSPGNEHSSEAELLGIKLGLVNPGFSHLSADMGKQCYRVRISHHFRYITGTMRKEGGGRTVIV